MDRGYGGSGENGKIDGVIRCWFGGGATWQNLQQNEQAIHNYAPSFCAI